MKLSYSDDFVFIHDAPDYHRTTLEGTLGAHPLKGKHRLPLNAYAMREIWKHLRDLCDNEFLEKGKQLAAPIEQPTTHSTDNRLRPYQRDDAARLAEMQVAAVFNSPRTGKTPTILEAMRLADTKRVLIVCPASLKFNWRAEIEKWQPDKTVNVINTPAQLAKLGAADYTVVSTKLVSRMLEPLNKMKFDCVVVDEAHFLRNTETTQSKAIAKLNMKRRYVLTGTPAVNHPSDVFGIYSFLQPKRYPGYWQFAERYFYLTEGMYKKEVLGVKPHRKAEFNDIQDRISIQRKRKEVMQWLPEKNFMTIQVEMNDKQARLYRDMLKTFRAELDDVTIDTQYVITQLLRLRQLAIDPRLVGFDVEGGKTEALLEYLDNHREPVIIMSMFTSYFDILRPELTRMGFKVGEISGEVTAKDKHAAAKAFQDGKYDILLCNVISAGTGFTLDRSNTVIFVDRAWTPTDNEQAEDRVCPTVLGQDLRHDILDFTTTGTVETRMLEVLKRKQTLNSVVNDRSAIRDLVR